MTLAKSQKQQLLILVAVATVVMGGIAIGITIYDTDSLWNMQSAKISIDEAAAIATTHLNTESSNLVEIEIEKEDNSFTYEAEFEIGDQEISVEIHPQTGEILEVEKETIDQEEDEEETDQEKDEEETDQEKDDDDD